MISGVNAYLIHTLSRTHFVCSSSLPAGYRKREWRYESVSASTQTLTENASLLRDLSPFIPPALHCSKFIFTHCTDTFSTGWHVYECDPWRKLIFLIHYSFQEDTYDASFHEIVSYCSFVFGFFFQCVPLSIVFWILSQQMCLCVVGFFSNMSACVVGIIFQHVCLCGWDYFPACLLVCSFDFCPPSALLCLDYPLQVGFV
jgi:hypothetical protein